MPSKTLIEGCGLFPRITLPTKCETTQFSKKIIFLLQITTMIDNLNHFLGCRDGPQNTVGERVWDGSPRESTQNIFFIQDLFSFFMVFFPLFYLHRALQFSCRKTRAMMPKYSHSSQNAILNTRTHLAALLSYENPSQSNTLN